jgi:hypothetical protein
VLSVIPSAEVVKDGYYANQHGQSKWTGTEHVRKQRTRCEPSRATDYSWRYDHQPVSFPMYYIQDTLLTQKHRPLDDNPLDLLPFVTQATFDASEKEDDPLCLPGTRVDLLQQIRAWAGGNDEGYIFWLSGWAGTGKSTIARTVAHECYDKGCLGASFFFSRGKEDVSHAGKFFTTLPYSWPRTFQFLGI